jgi:RNA-directed DNA polymerase
MAFFVDFKILRGVGAIAQMLGCSPGLIQSVVDGDESHFIEHKIPKRNPARGHRVVWEIESSKLLDAYRSLSDRFNEYALHQLGTFPHPTAHGYVRQRSILTNARVHVGAKRLLKADITGFFNAITTARVQRLFLELRLQDDTAEILARFATLRGSLPLGFPSSPVLANAVCAGLDKQLEELGRIHGCTYTRYADDLTFSTRSAQSDDLPKRIDIESALKEYDFTLSAEKFFVKKRGHAFYVTGLSISEDDRPRASSVLKKRLRQELHFVKKFGVRAHVGKRGYASYQAGINQIDGRIRFLHSIEPDLANELRDIWHDALAKAKVSVVHQAQKSSAPRVVTLFFDESVIEHNGKQLLLLGGILTEDVEEIQPVLVKFLTDELADPYGMSKKSALAKQGLHWKELHQDTRSKLTELVAALPLRAYVAYAELATEADYKHMYLELLNRIVSRRLIALDGRVANFVFEENPKVRIQDIESSILALDQAQLAKHGRRPIKLAVAKRGKLEEPCLALADALLALLGQFGKEQEDKSQSALRFERVRGKFRVIDSADEGRVFTRRDQFARGQFGPLTPSADTSGSLGT